MCRLQQLAMASRLTVVLVSLPLAIPAVIFWVWLLILPARVTVLCPEGCRCETEGYYINCLGSGLNSTPSIYPADVRLLVIDDNNITFFENDTFFSKGLIELEVLKADFCELRRIELGAFNGLTELIYMSIESNEISEIIPGTFEKTSSLEFLDLGKNVIEHLKSDVFYGLVNLKNISLEGNKLQDLHPDTFVGLPNLQRLILKNNVGLQIPQDRHFINSRSLKHLDISGCNVSSVSVETFANVSALEWLDLRYNNLRSIDINILKTLPKLSTLYLYGNPLQCDCQLQEMWRWCQDHNIETAYEGKSPECDTQSGVLGICGGMSEKEQSLQNNTHYYAAYKNSRHSYTPTAYMDTETEQQEHVHSFVKPYELPLSAILFIFGATGNVILIIIIICNKGMRTVPNMYILNLAISDMITLILLFYAAWAHKYPNLWLSGDLMCYFLPFCYRMLVGLSAYSVAMLSVQRYRVTVNPLDILFSAQPTWRGTGATICGVWIVAALFAIPAARSQYLCVESILLLRRKYYQHVVTFQLFVACVIPLCVIAFSYIMTAHHLVESSCSLSRESQNPHHNTRTNTAKVVLGLTFVFLISYLPYHIYNMYSYSRISLEISGVKPNVEFHWVISVSDIRVIIHLLLSLNPCLNPVSLCCTSLAFRRQFKRYLTCSCKVNFPSSDIELSRS
jgi:Leucine-rich repeat (LRR) protein